MRRLKNNLLMGLSLLGLSFSALALDVNLTLINNTDQYVLKNGQSGYDPVEKGNVCSNLCIQNFNNEILVQKVPDEVLKLYLHTGQKASHCVWFTYDVVDKGTQQTTGTIKGEYCPYGSSQRLIRAWSYSTAVDFVTESSGPATFSVNPK